jgi:hypothetical protein
MARKVATTIYITEEQQNLLKELNSRSKVPIAEYIRQGIDWVLDKNKELLPGQLELDPLPYGKLATHKYESKEHT